MWNLREALQEYNAKVDNPMTNIDIGRILWSDSSIESQRINISKLMKKDVKTVKVEFVEKLCEVLECDANKLFNIKK